MSSSPSAKVIADSISEIGFRLTTLEVTMHRFVLAEFNTHRVFSRNSASSRAIPVGKQIDRILTDPAFPVEFGSNQKGMQAGPPLEGMDLYIAENLWKTAANMAVEQAQKLMELGVHKQVTNRLLEPYMWHKVIVTSPEWENFFNQRCSPLAQPEIRDAAYAIREAYDNSEPKILVPNEWHMPYINEQDYTDAFSLMASPSLNGIQIAVNQSSAIVEILKRVSVARCARVSYLTHDGLRDLSEDLTLYDRLATADPPHYSPMEHVATPDNDNVTWIDDVPLARLGNFPGWSQHRHEQKEIQI